MGQPLSPTTVDLSQLQQMVGRLQQLQQFIESRCLSALPPINDALGAVSNIDMSDSDYKFTRQATVFGGFYSAYGMQARNDGVYRAVEESLKELIQHLGQAVEATQTIIGNYRRIEESNTNMAADIERLLLGQPTETTAAPDYYSDPRGPTSVA